MSHFQIAIASLVDDLHALAVLEALSGYDDLDCALIETNGLVGRGGLSWWSESHGRSTTVPVRGGATIDVRALDLIWWRRTNFPQELPPWITDPAHRTVIDNDSNATLGGVFLCDFDGVWVDPLLAIRRAENKLVQLRQAHRAGLHIPATLVSQDAATIRRFCAEQEQQVVVKTVAGSATVPLVTRKVTPDLLESTEALQLAPAIYQRYIPGDRHLRVHCFGDAVFPTLIESKQLDWRTLHDTRLSATTIDDDLRSRLLAVLRALGLSMGIFDLKLTAEGEPVWLEVNPQGQFLFAEQLTGVPLTEAFAAFLYSRLPARADLHQRRDGGAAIG